MVRVETLGAGGGSICHVNNGALQVGPASAGAEPGPICYGRGGSQPTVTDALLMRMTLVPALLAILRERLWWIPAWLDKALPNITIEAPGEHATRGTEALPGRSSARPST